MITVIAAISEDGFIGKNDRIPWLLKSDMNHFKKTTSGCTVVMGRKTWDSIPAKFRPLPNRRNIVVTNQRNFQALGAEVVHSLDEALFISEEDEQVFIIGGATIYEQVLPFAERLLLTRVHATIGDGDAQFPMHLIDDNWNLVSKTDITKSTGDEYSFQIEDYTPNLPFIELANVRTHSQLKTMRTIRKAGHCPFCRENLDKYHKELILFEGKHWIVTKNQWPYPEQNVHLLLILKNHEEEFDSLNSSALEELVEIIQDLKLRKVFEGGGICVRTGDPLLSGATVKHLHIQVISPKKESVVKFYIGTSNRQAVL